MAITAELKQQLIQKALNRGELSLKDFAARHNIANSTIYKWLKQLENNEPSSASRKLPTSKTNQALEHVLACANLDDVAIGKYCREHGIYSHDLPRWQEELMSKDITSHTKKYREEIKALKATNKQLERELRRKDKALAETAAILVLKKKAEQIFGEDGVV